MREYLNKIHTKNIYYRKCYKKKNIYTKNSFKRDKYPRRGYINIHCEELLREDQRDYHGEFVKPS